MKAQDFTLDQLEQIKRLWWAEACREGIIRAIYEVLIARNPGNGVVILDHSVKLTMNNAAMIRNDGSIDGDVTVHGGGGEQVVNTKLALFVPGPWEPVIHAEHRKIKAEEETAAAQKIEAEVETLRQQLLLHNLDGCQKAEHALSTIRGLMG